MYRLDVVRADVNCRRSSDLSADFARRLPTIESDCVCVGSPAIERRAPISELPSSADPINNRFRRRRKFHHRIRQICYSRAGGDKKFPKSRKPAIAATPTVRPTLILANVANFGDEI